MKKNFLLVVLLLIVRFVSAQNVGIGTSTPTEKLDVNGNINLSGTITAKGVAGQPGEVLRTNVDGNLEWGSVGGCAFTNFAAFNVTGGGWNVPEGVAKIVIEAWGSGGGGSQYGGGGGGGYIRAQFAVNAGATVTVSLGLGGVGGTTDGGSGSPTTVFVQEATGTTYTVTASGGLGAYISGNNIYAAAGGTYTINPGYANYTGATGQTGTPNSYSYTQTDAGIFSKLTVGGKGGDGGNSLNTGGGGGYHLQPIYAVPAEGLDKGGGGGGSVETGFNGASGGRGKVIIWY